jgi:hypothetical protein
MAERSKRGIYSGRGEMAVAEALEWLDRKDGFAVENARTSSRPSHRSYANLQGFGS